MSRVLLLVLLLCSGLAMGTEGDPRAGAISFGRYCLACHGQEYQRFDRVAADLHLDLASWAPGRTPSAPMLGLLKPEDARVPLAACPGSHPDRRGARRGLARAFLQEFYVAPGRPLGVDNLRAPGTRMPDVLAALRGRQVRDSSAGRACCAWNPAAAPDARAVRAHRRRSGRLPRLFRRARAQPGLAPRALVLGYLLLFAVLAFWLKREFWRRLPDSER